MTVEPEVEAYGDQVGAGVCWGGGVWKGDSRLMPDLGAKQHFCGRVTEALLR